MSTLHQEINRHLGEIKEQGLYRQLSEPKGIDFSSNDYLGLSKDSSLRNTILQALQKNYQEYPLSSPASRLLRGHTDLHRRVETRLARFKGAEDALLFSSGYQANIGLLTTLIGPQDRVLSDAHNHASIIDGLRLSRCETLIFPHLSISDVKSLLAQPNPRGRTFLVTESIFSMDGDVAPLLDYADLVKRYGAELIVDDAHATGIFGQDHGSGLLENFGIQNRALASVSTFGKAFGLFGACVAGPSWLIEYLVNHCRTFIFTTSVPPLLLVGIETVLDIIETQSERRLRVLELSNRLRSQLKAGGINVGKGWGPIVPIIIGSNQVTLDVAKRLQTAGFDIRAIRPPTVPTGTERLRISVHADHSEQEIDELGSALLDAPELQVNNQKP